MTEELSQPVAQQSRLVTLDIIRGVALLGILIMNIQAFSMVFSAYSNPTSFGDLTGVNFYVYYLSHLLADQKFMTIFSMLFGVGIVLMADNVERKGGKAGKFHFKRMFLLALFGIAHAYLLWFGDILFAYALAGMLVYLARRKSPRFLIIFGAILIAICSFFMYSVGLLIPKMPAADMQEMMNMWAPTQELIDKDLSANLSSWMGQMEQRHTMAATMQGNVIFYLFRIVGVMMLGMALYKMDFFGKRFSNKGLVISAIVTLVAGLAFIAHGNTLNFAGNWGVESMFIGVQYNYWGSIIVAYSYVALLIVLCRSNVLTKTKAMLANVGRMALTNYLSQTIICCFIFYGWGLGFYGSFERIEQLYVVLGIWAFQLVFSAYWMNNYRFGPFEWLWRSMTYGKLQPLKK